MGWIIVQDSIWIIFTIYIDKELANYAHRNIIDINNNTILCRTVAAPPPSIPTLLCFIFSPIFHISQNAFLKSTPHNERNTLNDKNNWTPDLESGLCHLIYCKKCYYIYLTCRNNKYIELWKTRLRTSKQDGTRLFGAIFSHMLEFPGLDRGIWVCGEWGGWLKDKGYKWSSQMVKGKEEKCVLDPIVNWSRFGMN